MRCSLRLPHASLILSNLYTDTWLSSHLYYIKFTAILWYAAKRFLLCFSVTCFKLMTDTALQQGHLILIMPSASVPQSNSLLFEQFGQCTCICLSVVVSTHTPPRNYRVLFNKSHCNLFHWVLGSDKLIISRTSVRVNGFL